MHAERIPRAGSGWTRLPSAMDYRADASAWTRGRLRVLSTLDETETNGWVGPTWILSLSRRGNRRPNDRELLRMVRDFGVPSPYDEDNHENGIARKVFCPTEPSARTACECKVTEEVVVEPDGYRWSRPKTEDEEDKRRIEQAAGLADFLRLQAREAAFRGTL